MPVTAQDELPAPPKLYTPKQIADRYPEVFASAWAVEELARAGEAECIRLGKRRSIRFRADQVPALLDAALKPEKVATPKSRLRQRLDAPLAAAS